MTRLPPSKDKKVITYTPQFTDTTPAGMVQRGVWLYTHKLGMEFTLVLILSLGYQLLVAVYLGIRVVKNLPLLSWIPKDEPAYQVIGYGVGILVGVFFQMLLIAEAAQIIWLRRTDRLKNRLLSDSYWWWVHLSVLGLITALSFVLLFMAITGTSDIPRAIQAATESQRTFIATVLLSLLNCMTLIRCASVMRTSTTEENRREVEERLAAISEEILLDASDATRSQVQQVWSVLNTDPRRFIPLQSLAVDLIRKNHPELFPPGMGGDTWGYDVAGNTFAALPPNVHHTLSQARNKRNRFQDADQKELWGMPAGEVAQVVEFNVEAQGKPRYVDLTDPAKPGFAYEPADLLALPAPADGREMKLTNHDAPSPDKGEKNPEETPANYFNQIPAAERVKFAAFLKNAAFPEIHGQKWIDGASEIWEVFDLVELKYLYRRFSQGTGAQENAHTKPSRTERRRNA